MNIARPTDEEILQTYETIVALIKRRDEIAREVDGEPMEVGQLIKAAGSLRDELDPEDVPRAKDIDPDELFADGEVTSE